MLFLSIHLTFSLSSMTITFCSIYNSAILETVKSRFTFFIFSTGLIRSPPPFLFLSLSPFWVFVCVLGIAKIPNRLDFILCPFAQNLCLLFFHPQSGKEEMEGISCTHAFKTILGWCSYDPSWMFGVPMILGSQFHHFMILVFKLESL